MRRAARSRGRRRACRGRANVSAPILSRLCGRPRSIRRTPRRVLDLSPRPSNVRRSSRRLCRSPSPRRSARTSGGSLRRLVRRRRRCRSPRPCSASPSVSTTPPDVATISSESALPLSSAVADHSSGRRAVRRLCRERLALAVRCAAVADLLDAPSIVACAVAVVGRLLDPRAVRFVRLALDLLDALGRACAVRTMPRLFRAGNGSRPLADPVGTTSPLRVVEVRRSPSASGRVSLTH